ncbi:hypothetical protein GOODEAATRI_030680, partial [Goodea atripinnis]
GFFMFPFLYGAHMFSAFYSASCLYCIAYLSLWDVRVAQGLPKHVPRPVVTPEDQVVLKNGEAMFHCRFTAEPEPTLEWYHENELLANKSRYAAS